ncbi:hypothetical protein KM043_012558 [Ampulex compressa]|nr:hypothetical protein KM043_012558 [Ampulex compressa]
MRDQRVPRCTRLGAKVSNLRTNVPESPRDRVSIFHRKEKETAVYEASVWRQIAMDASSREKSSYVTLGGSKPYVLPRRVTLAKVRPGVRESFVSPSSRTQEVT